MNKSRRNMRASLYVIIVPRIISVNMNTDEGPPKVTACWFQAVDVVARDLTPFSSGRKPSKPMQKPSEWKPFSSSDSQLIENAYILKRTDSSAALVAVGEDFLFEANTLMMEVSPVHTFVLD